MVKQVIISLAEAVSAVTRGVLGFLNTKVF